MMIVSLLSTSPKNGVELMDGVEEMTRGWWRPTAGSIYPLLTTMVGEGTVKKRDGDGRYELTLKARKELEYSLGPRLKTPRTSEGIFKEISAFVAFAEDLEKASPGGLDSSEEEVRDIIRRLTDIASRMDAKKAAKTS
jgi:DNA-binding PadR family transcriptional regulator